MGFRSARADAFYDALKAKGKYDAKTAADVRKSTIDTDRMNQMNALTANNPDFKPLPKVLPPPLSEAEIKRLKAEDANEPETADDRLDREAEAKLKRGEAKDALPSKLATANAVPLAPGSPGKSNLTAPPPVGRGPTLYLQTNGPPVKVVNEDPDEVSFVSEEEPPVKTKANLKPVPSQEK